jgi:hypothetical protein
MALAEHAQEHERPFDPAHDIFVFGSNESGHHGAGAAAYAVRHAGAKMGEGVGPTGNAYAIVTMSGLPRIREEVARFVDYAKVHPELSFFVTRIGCGIAGYQDNAIAPLFKDAPENCLLPLGWRDLAELRAGLEPSPKVY